MALMLFIFVILGDTILSIMAPSMFVIESPLFDYFYRSRFDSFLSEITTSKASVSGDCPVSRFTSNVLVWISLVALALGLIVAG